MYTIELNNMRKDSDALVNNKLNEKSPIVEIFSAAANGESLDKFGGKADVAMNKIKELSQRAMAGDYSAKAEMNTIVRFAIEPKLIQAIQLFSFMGTFRQIGYNEQPMMTSYKHESIRSGFQANSGDVPFATTTWEEYPISTQTISAGYAVNYREVASGNLDRVAEGMSQVQTDMMNKAMHYVVKSMYDAIKDAQGVKYFAEASGIAKSAVDDVLKKVRRFGGSPAIVGDYSVISQLNAFAGFKSDPADSTANKLSEMVMEEIRRTGLLNSYNGSNVVELPNQYNLTKLNAAGDNFKTYLPEGLMFFLPRGAVSALQVFQRGGLTSATGIDIVSGGTEITRYDLEIGSGVAKNMTHTIGMLSDTDFEAPSLNF